MGSLCSKLSLCSKFSTHQGGHTVLGQGSTVGGEAEGPNDPNPSDPRAAAAAAAERRAKESRKGGKLAKQLEAQRGRTKAPSPEPPDRLVWD